MNKREESTYKVNQAVKKGVLTKKFVCELCGTDTTKPIHDSLFGYTHTTRIVGHHWRGYDYPLDVWWICASCNRRLIGEKCHNGSLSKKQARALVTSMDWHTIESEYRQKHAPPAPIRQHINEEERIQRMLRAVRAAFGE